jgi:hypothetical protein
VPPALADAIVDTLARAPITCYVTLLDIELGLEKEPDFFATVGHVRDGTHVPRRALRAPAGGEDDLGLIVVDSRFREEDTRLRRFFADLQKDGTPYSRLDRIVEGLFLGPSHYSIGLQCADLVVAITAAAERGGGHALGYLRKLMPRFAVHPRRARLEGVGIKRFPDVSSRARAKRTRLF